MTKERMSTAEIGGAGLLERLSGLFGRVLFVESEAWKGSRDRFVGGMRYVELARKSPVDALSDMINAKSRQWPHNLPDQFIRRWQWFEPDPVGMEEHELEALVQSRRMSPLWLELNREDGWGEEMRVYVVPRSVLARPVDPQRPRGYCGEPWCHRCNETLFWDPNVKEVPSYPVGLPGSFVQGIRCMNCGHTSPAQLVASTQ